MKIKKDMRSMKILPTQFCERKSELLQSSFGYSIYRKNQPMNESENGKNTHLILKKDGTATPQLDFLIETLIELFHGLSLANNQGNITINETKVYYNTIQKIKNEMHLHQYDHRIKEVDLTLNSLLHENFSTKSLGNALPILENYIKKNEIYKQFSQTKNSFVGQNSFEKFIENHINNKWKSKQDFFLDKQLVKELNVKENNVKETFIQKFNRKSNIFLPTIFREKNNVLNTKTQYYLTGHENTIYRMEQIGTGISEEIQLWLVENQGQQLLEKSLANSLNNFYLNKINGDIQQFLSGNSTVSKEVIRCFYEKSATNFYELEKQTEKTYEDFREKIYQSTEKSMAFVLKEISKLQIEQNNTINTKMQNVMPIYNARLGGMTLEKVIQNLGFQMKSVTNEMVEKTMKIDMVNNYSKSYIQKSFQNLVPKGNFIKQEKEIFRNSHVISNTTLVNRLLPQSNEYATFHELYEYFQVNKESFNILNKLKNQVTMQNGIWQIVNEKQWNKILEFHNTIDLKTEIKNYNEKQQYHFENVYQNQVMHLLENQKSIEQNLITWNSANYLHINQTEKLAKFNTSLFYEGVNQNSFPILMGKGNSFMEINQAFLNHWQRQIYHDYQSWGKVVSYSENHSKSNNTHFLRELLHKKFFVGTEVKSHNSPVIYENNSYSSKIIPQNNGIEIVPKKIVSSKIVKNMNDKLTNQVLLKFHRTVEKQLFTSVINESLTGKNEVEIVSQTRNAFWNYGHNISTIFEVLKNKSLTENAYNNGHILNLYQNYIHSKDMQLPILKVREWQRNKLKYTKELEQQIIHKKESNTIHTVVEIAKENSALILRNSQTEKSLSTHMDFMKMHQTHEILQKTRKQNIVNSYENNHLFFNYEKFYIGQGNESYFSLDSVKKMYHNKKISVFNTNKSEVLFHETNRKLEHKITNEMTEKYNEFVIKKEMPPVILEDMEEELQQFIAKTVDEKIAVIKEEVYANKSVEEKEEVEEKSEKSEKTPKVFTETDVERIYEKVYTKIERALESERRRMGY